MLVLADRKFLSWSAARAFPATGAHILWRASASFTLKPVQALADGTYLAELKPPRKSDGPPVTVRVIEYTETVIGHHKTGMGEGQPVLRSGDPEGVMQEMWALFAVYQAICRIAGLAVDAAGIPRTGSASRTPWPPRRTRSRLPP